MAIFKCKMCGGDLELTEGSSIATCEYCGTTQTVPSADNEKKLTLFNRANRLRAACEFDKAFGVYEAIVADFPEEAEAYWGLVLCKYGIEYVDDPKTGKKIPTCHRSSFESVMDDTNFEQVMENSDPLSRSVYREEAKQIEELRKGIIEISAKEEPYDIFICYKETDAKGDRTLDSVLAQDVYDSLTEKGYRVFFSRITLEDKLGQEYEPYIFAALNSAKVMLVFGTDYEHFNAVWVKNEWSRFLELIEKGEKKTLIPCFKNIDAYDMPKEFAKLQAQDMGKVGAVQDLARGISKIISADKNTTIETADIQNVNETLESLLEEKRIREKKSKTIKTIAIVLATIIALVALTKYAIIPGIIHIKTVVIPDIKYNEAAELMENGNYTEAITKFEALNGYRDSADQIRESKYRYALSLMEEKKYEEAINIFETYKNYKDSSDQLKEIKYRYASALQDNGDYINANALFKEIYQYKDSFEKYKSILFLSNKQSLKDISVGSYVNFGTYKQDNNSGNAPESIQWLVLDIQDNKALVISKSALSSQPYNSDSLPSTWETSTLRQWLNNDFVNYAFSDIEKSLIPTVTVNNDKNPNYPNQTSENATQDKLFVLSINEATKYLNSTSRKSSPVAESWWLRTTGASPHRAAFVTSEGEINRIGSDKKIAAYIRPAMWIDLSQVQ